jgi:hypothetical protein
MAVRIAEYMLNYHFNVKSLKYKHKFQSSSESNFIQSVHVYEHEYLVSTLFVSLRT